MKIEEVLKEGKERLIENQIEDANIIARVLLQHILKLERHELIQKQGQQVKMIDMKEYEKAIQKVIDGIPLQYITNKQEFMKLSFYVDENVLIPQPDTEILVEEVLSIANEENKKEILDICTGSGCIGISLAYYLQNVKITMSDISKGAIKIVKKNAENNKVLEKVKIIESDLFENIEEKFDIIVSNPPYIETNVIKTLSKQVQREPSLALDGGEDGLLFYRNIIKESKKYLKEDGYLCLEIGYDQKEKVMKLAREIGNFSKIESKKDLSGNDRGIICKR